VVAGQNRRTRGERNTKVTRNQLQKDEEIYQTFGMAEEEE